MTHRGFHGRGGWNGMNGGIPGRSRRMGNWWGRGPGMGHWAIGPRTRRSMMFPLGLPFRRLLRGGLRTLLGGLLLALLLRFLF